MIKPNYVVILPPTQHPSFSRNLPLYSGVKVYCSYSYLPQVAPETTYFSTVCHCTHLTNFGGGFLVAPNPIDFSKALSGFGDIASNPVVFATVVTIFGLYFVGVIWARWRDKKDLEKVILV